MGRKLLGKQDIKHRKIRVLFITPWYPTPSNRLSGLFIKEHAKSVSDQTTTIVLACIEEALLGKLQFRIENYCENNINTFIVYYHKINTQLPTSIKNILRGMLFFIASIKGFRRICFVIGSPDLINANITLPSGVTALFIRLILNVPYVVTEHLSNPLKEAMGYGKINIVEKTIMKIVNKYAYNIIVPSKAMGESLKKLGLAKKYDVIHPCIEKPSDQYIRTTNYLDENKTFKYVHTSIMDDKKKNISGILKAFSGVLENGVNNTELHLIGDGPDFKRLKQMARDLGIPKRAIFFHGALYGSHKSALLANCNVFILFSNCEGFSIATAEALAHGLPAIVTDCGGPREYISKKYGIIIKGGDIRSLTKAMLEIRNAYKNYDPIFISTSIIDKFSPQNVGGKLHALFNRSISEHEYKIYGGLSATRLNTKNDYSVIDVGSGHRPNPRAEALLDKYIDRGLQLR